MQSIKGNIFSYVALVLVVSFLLLSGTALFLVERLVEDITIDENRNALVLLTENIRTRYWKRLNTLDQIAVVDEFTTLDVAKAKDAAQMFLNFSYIFSTLHMYAPSGDLIFAIKRNSIGPYRIVQNYHEHRDPTFAKLADSVIATGKPQASSTFYTRTNELYQVYLVPVFAKNDAKKVIALLSGGVFPRFLNLDDILAGLTLSKRNFMFVADDKGNPIAMNGSALADLPKPVRKKVAEKCQAIAEDQGQQNDLNKQKEFAASVEKEAPFRLITVPMPDLKLSVTLGVNTQTINAKVTQLGRALMAAFILCLLFGLFMSRVFGNRLVKMLASVLKAVKEINRGNFDYPIKRTAKGELGEIATHLEDIRRKIKKDKILGDLWMEKFKDNV